MKAIKVLRTWVIWSLVILIAIVIAWYQIVARDVLPRRDPNNDWFYWVGFGVLAIVVVLRGVWSVRNARKKLRVRTLDEAIAAHKGNDTVLEEIYEDR
jgi:H+/Cl- antiporter ClcA